MWRVRTLQHYFDQLLLAIFNPTGPAIGTVLPGLDWRSLAPAVTETAVIETPDQLDMVGRRWDVRYSLDRTTFHRLQHQSLTRASSIDVGVLQIIDYINGYGYTYCYRSRAAVILGASNELDTTPYRVVSYCAEYLRANDVSVSALCDSIENLVRRLRMIIGYVVSFLSIGSDLILLLLVLLHISVYVTIELTHRSLTHCSDSHTLVLGETYYALMVHTKFMRQLTLCLTPAQHHMCGITLVILPLSDPRHVVA